MSVTDDDGDDAIAPWGKAVASRATRERGRRTLVKLLEAAVAEFSAYGYHGARVARVAQRAGTSHGTFYVYFEDKDDLLVAVFEEGSQDTEELLQDLPALTPGPAGYDELRAWVARVCASFQRQGAIRGSVHDALYADADQRITDLALRHQRRWVEALADRIRGAGPTGLDPTLAGSAIYGLLDSSNRAVFRGTLLVGLDELVDGVAEFMQRSVFGAGAAPEG